MGERLTEDIRQRQIERAIEGFMSSSQFELEAIVGTYAQGPGWVPASAMGAGGRDVAARLSHAPAGHG